MNEAIQCDPQAVPPRLQHYSFEAWLLHHFQPVTSGSNLTESHRFEIA
jgi:hypothetical protein